jgi:hypothetical protein
MDDRKPDDGWDYLGPGGADGTDNDDSSGYAGAASHVCACDYS